MKGYRPKEVQRHDPIHSMEQYKLAAYADFTAHHAFQASEYPSFRTVTFLFTGFNKLGGSGCGAVKSSIYNPQRSFNLFQRLMAAGSGFG